MEISCVTVSVLIFCEFIYCDFTVIILYNRIKNWRHFSSPVLPCWFVTYNNNIKFTAFLYLSIDMFYFSSLKVSSGPRVLHAVCSKEGPNQGGGYYFFSEPCFRIYIRIFKSLYRYSIHCNIKYPVTVHILD